MIVYSKVSKSFWYLLLSLINISLLTSCDWEGVGSICCLGCFGFARNRPMFFLWAAFAAIYCWDLAAISLDDFDSNILLSFGSNSLWAAFRSNILLRFGSNFFGRLWQQYFIELRQQFSLDSFSQQYIVEIWQQFLWTALTAIFLLRLGSYSL